MKYGTKALESIPNKGGNVFVEDGFQVFNGELNIFLGSNIFLVDALINAGDQDGEVRIEDDVFFGHGVKVLARGHDYTKHGVERQRSITEKPILIKKGAWVASGAIVLGGVTIGENAVVGAGSVVTKSVPDDVFVAGNPARVRKFIGKRRGLCHSILPGYIKRIMRWVNGCMR